MTEAEWSAVARRIDNAPIDHGAKFTAQILLIVLRFIENAKATPTTASLLAEIDSILQPTADHTGGAA